MSFEALVKSMTTLVEANGLASTQNDDAAAAAAAAASTATADAGKTPEQLEAEEAAAAAAPMAKSMTLTLDDGTEVEAFDGGEMLKALGARMDATDTTVKQLLGQAVMIIGAQGAKLEELTKSLADQGALLVQANETIAGMRTDIEVVRQQPGGRKSVTIPAHVDGGAPMVKSLANGDEQQGLPPQEFLTKCLSLQKDGHLSLQEVAIAEAAIGSNMAVPDAIRNKVFSTK